jgi:hypothetical protein
MSWINKKEIVHLNFFLYSYQYFNPQKYRHFRLNHPVYYSVQLRAFEGITEGRNLLKHASGNKGLEEKELYYTSLCAVVQL